MAKKFTKLFLGDVVHTVGSKVFRKLTTEQPIVEDELQGTWVFNQSITGDYFLINVSFISNNTQYERIYNEPDNSESLNYYNSAGYTEVYIYYMGSWTNEAYRTINITSKLAEVENGEELLAWLKANATKQDANTPTLITFTISGTTYQAEEGMTWLEWVGSAYNTLGFYCDGGRYNIRLGGNQYVQDSDGTAAIGSDIITNGGRYFIAEYGGGGSN